MKRRHGSEKGHKRNRNTAGRQAKLQREGERTRGKEGSGSLKRADTKGMHGARSGKLEGLTGAECWRERSATGINMDAKSWTSYCSSAKSTDGWPGSVAHLSLSYWNVYQMVHKRIQHMNGVPDWDATNNKLMTITSDAESKAWQMRLIPATALPTQVL